MPLAVLPVIASLFFVACFVVVAKKLSCSALRVARRRTYSCYEAPRRVLCLIQADPQIRSSRRKNFAGFKPEDDLRKSCCSSAPTIRETFSSTRDAQTLRTEGYGELQALDIHRCWVILGLLWRMANAAAETDTRGLDRQLF